MSTIFGHIQNLFNLKRKLDLLPMVAEEKIKDNAASFLKKHTILGKKVSDKTNDQQQKYIFRGSRFLKKKIEQSIRSIENQKIGHTVVHGSVNAYTKFHKWATGSMPGQAFRDYQTSLKDRTVSQVRQDVTLVSDQQVKQAPILPPKPDKFKMSYGEAKFIKALRVDKEENLLESDRALLEKARNVNLEQKDYDRLLDLGLMYNSNTRCIVDAPPLPTPPQGPTS